MMVPTRLSSWNPPKSEVSSEERRFWSCKPDFWKYCHQSGMAPGRARSEVDIDATATLCARIPTQTANQSRVRSKCVRSSFAVGKCPLQEMTESKGRDCFGTS